MKKQMILRIKNSQRMVQKVVIQVSKIQIQIRRNQDLIQNKNQIQMTNKILIQMISRIQIHKVHKILKLK